MKTYWKYYCLLIFVLLTSCDSGNQVISESPDTVKTFIDSGNVKKNEEIIPSTTKVEPMGDSLTSIYLSRLTQLPLPFRVSTEESVEKMPIMHFSDQIEQEVGQWGLAYGKLFERDIYAVTVHISPGDGIPLPVLHTMDYSGNIIDKLPAFECYGAEADYSCKEFLEVDENGSIQFTDSTFYYELDKNGMPVSSSERLEVVWRLYRISEKGYFDLIEEEKK
jgi:hypothetical protein